MDVISAQARLIVALYVATIREAINLVDTVSPVISTFKIGYWLLFEPELNLLITRLKTQKKKIFLDAKLNDIPETVKHGVQSAAHNGFDYITVHSDQAMLEAAVEGAHASNIKVMAVTALTSMPQEISTDRFRNGVINAIITNCDGLIMSPSDLNDNIGLLTPGHNVRSLVGDMIIATPGIRATGDTSGGHARLNTPQYAIQSGADFIIVGRAIVHAKQPLVAANNIIAAIAECD